MTLTLELLPDEDSSVFVNKPTLTSIPGGGVMVWRLGADEGALVGTQQRIRFEVKDGRGGTAFALTTISVVDPLRYGRQPLSLTTPTPDAFLVEGACVQPVVLGVKTGEGSPDLLAFDLTHTQMECSDAQACQPVLNRVSSRERTLSWCASPRTLASAIDHELFVSIGVQQGITDLRVPIGFRFLDSGLNACGSPDMLTAAVVESRFTQSGAVMRLAIQGENLSRVMMSLSRQETVPLHGQPTYEMTWLGGDQWYVQFVWPFAVVPADPITVLVTAVQTSEGCQQLLTSEPLSFVVRAPEPPAMNSVAMCTSCSVDEECGSGRCLIIDGFGKCSPSCTQHSDCGDAAFCVGVDTLDEQRAFHCIPKTNSCLAQCVSKSDSSVLNEERSAAVACNGRRQIFKREVDVGEGIRIRTVTEAERLDLGMSVRAFGQSFWDLWHAEKSDVYELLCAQEPLTVEVEVWPWWGNGAYSIATERLTGDCGSRCVPDVLDDTNEIQRVSDTIEYSRLSLCGFDTDVFEMAQEEGESWEVRLTGLDEERRIRLRVLGMPSYTEHLNVLVGRTSTFDLASFAEDRFRLLLTSETGLSVRDYGLRLQRFVGD